MMCCCNYIAQRTLQLHFTDYPNIAHDLPMIPTSQGLTVSLLSRKRHSNHLIATRDTKAQSKQVNEKQ